MEAETQHSHRAAAYSDEEAAAEAKSSPQNICSALGHNHGGESQPPHDVIDDTTAAEDFRSPPAAAGVVVVSPNSSSSGSQKNDDDAATTTLSSTNNTKQQKYRNINSYYGHKIGFYQTFSLILNAGLMIYAHLGLSAVIYSSRDPSITAALDNNSGSGGVEGNATNTNSTDTSAAACNSQDVEIWIQSGGESTRPTQSNFCS
ncbi:hypothetical protein ACHAXM_000148, partial [Skeletonema potamos]